MKAFFKFFAERHLLANLLTIMIFLMGITAVFRINRSELPKVEMGKAIVTTRYPGASPEDVELNVTNKIEDELKGVSDIKNMLSVSMENVSIIDITIEDDVEDMDEVQTNIREAVARVTEFPAEVTSAPLVSEIKTTRKPILEIGIASDTLSYAELREYARQFEKQLKDIPGVAELDRLGYRAREVRVEVSPDKIMKYKLPLQEIISAIQARNIRASGGSLESYTSEKNVVTLAQFRDPAEVGDVIIRSSLDGAMVRVKDLAVVIDDFEEERVIPRMNGIQAISFTVRKSESVDIIRTVEAIKALVEKEKARLPESIEFLYSTDESKAVQSRFDIVRSNGIMGLVLVLIVLAIFLNVRSSFWVAMGIPFTLLGVVIFLPFFDVELDSLTLTSMVLVLGIIVDDAIVISENIFHRREQGDAPLEAAVNGLHEVYMPVLTTIATTMLAFIPMFFMKGMLGKFTFIIPLTIILALTMSLFESFFILPAHLLPGLQQKTGKKRSFGRTWFRPLRDRFETLIYKLLQLRYVILILAIVLLVGSLLYAKNFLDFILFDAKGANSFTAFFELPIGTSLQATSDKMREIETIFDNLPEGEVESYALRIGSLQGEFMINNETENAATFVVDLTPYGTRKRTADEIVEEIRSKVSQVQGLTNFSFSIESGGPPTGRPIEIRLIGSVDEMRHKLADDVMAFLKNIDGTKDMDRDDKPGKDEITLNIDYERLARYGLTVADIAQNVRIAYDGQAVTSVRYGEDDVDFRVIVEKAFRQQLGYIKNLRIPNRRGELVAIDEVAELEIGPGLSTFNHYEGERTISITGDVFQDKITPVEVMDALEEEFLSRLHTDYPGMRMKIGGEAEESRKAMLDLALTFAMAGLGIYFLLMLLFNSSTQPFMVMLAIPFGLCGVILAFVLHSAPLTFLAMMGIIGMAGVVVNDSLVLVDHLNTLIRSGDKRNLVQLVAIGTANRLRPIILTTVTTVAGLLPLAYGLGGQDIYMAPMALALSYGLLFATPITLILLPCLYMIGQDIGNLVKRGEK